MNAQSESKIQFVSETPDVHRSEEVQGFIEREVCKPSKAWVQDVVSSKRECESVKLRTDDFVLLPDTNASRRQCKSYATYGQAGGVTKGSACWSLVGSCKGQALTQEDLRGLQGLPRWAGGSRLGGKATVPSMFAPSPSAGKSFNWLAIVTDPSLRSVRDLRGEHVPMLEQMYEQCIGVIHNEFGVSRQDVMAFANYPPSVYRLHIHFCAPFFLSSAYDAFRMHSLSGIINNLKINADYYKLSTFYIPVHCGSDLHKVWEDGDGNKSGAQESIA